MNSFSRNVSLGLLTMACLSQVTASAANYNFRTINNPADMTFNQLLGINNAGTIVGYYGSGSATAPNKGYSYSNGTFTNENVPNSSQTQVVGINNNATPTTVGFSVDGNGNNFGFTRQGAFKIVSDPNVGTSPTTTQLLGVNNSNVAAGFYIDGNGHNQAFTYGGNSTFSALTLPGSFGAISTTATDINNAGVISGFFTDAANITHGFIENGTTFTQVDDPNGSTNTMIFGLNNKGEYVGSFVDGAGNTNGFTYNAATGNWTTVDDPHNSATAAFNVAGTTINGVNDLGQVVGFYSDGVNVDGFLASPTPEPASLGLLGLSLLGGAFVLRRKAAK